MKTFSVTLVNIDAEAEVKELSEPTLKTVFQLVSIRLDKKHFEVFAMKLHDASNSIKNYNKVCAVIKNMVSLICLRKLNLIVQFQPLIKRRNQLYFTKC